LTLHLYHGVNQAFPPGNGWGWAWSGVIIPFLELDNIYKELKLNLPWWTIPDNEIPIQRLIPTYRCPSAPALRLYTCVMSNHKGLGETHYSGIATHTNAYYAMTDANTGSGVLHWSEKNPVRISDIKDGTSATLMVGEAVPYPLSDPTYQSDCMGTGRCPGGKHPLYGYCELSKVWTGSNSITTYYGINKNPTYLQAGVQCYHSGGANFTFADGHVAFLNDNIKQSTLVALTTRGPGMVPSGTKDANGANVLPVGGYGGEVVSETGF
jgi:prepilin-type processing-associated H-X9-DG protein